MPRIYMEAPHVKVHTEAPYFEDLVGNIEGYDLDEIRQFMREEKRRSEAFEVASSKETDSESGKEAAEHVKNEMRKSREYEAHLVGIDIDHLWPIELVMFHRAFRKKDLTAREKDPVFIKYEKAINNFIASEKRENGNFDELSNPHAAILAAIKNEFVYEAGEDKLRARSIVN